MSLFEAPRLWYYYRSLPIKTIARTRDDNRKLWSLPGKFVILITTFHFFWLGIVWFTILSWTLIFSILSSIYVYVCVYIHVCVWMYLTKTEDGCWIFWRWYYRWLSAAWYCCGAELWISARVLHILSTEPSLNFHAQIFQEHHVLWDFFFPVTVVSAK